MKFLFDFFPLILFFVVYKIGNGNEAAALAIAEQYLGGMVSGGKILAEQAPTMLATVVAIIATMLQVGYLLARKRKVDGMLWVSLFVIVVFGGMTIYLHDETFIKWKPTIIYWIFAAALLISQLFFGKNLMRKAMEEQIKLPDAVWKRVGFAWIGFMAAMGVLNLVMAFVIFKGNTSAWVSFKMFGATGLFFVFVVAQTLMLSKYMQEPEDAK